MKILKFSIIKHSRNINCLPIRIIKICFGIHCFTLNNSRVSFIKLCIPVRKVICIVFLYALNKAIIFKLLKLFIIYFILLYDVLRKMRLNRRASNSIIYKSNRNMFTYMYILGEIKSCSAHF